MPTWYDAKVLKIENESPNTRRFWVEVAQLEQFDFKAGQFVTMDLPIGEKRLERWRSYSIADAPDGDNVLEFCIVKLDGGRATTYLFDEVEPGSSLRFKGPDGAFVLPDTIENDVVMICTGTGVAPFRSMLGDIVNSGKTTRGLHLIFGTRQAEGMLYTSEFQALQAQLPNFHYSVALSRENDWGKLPQGIDIRHGYVHQFYLEQYAQVRPDVRFYLCGWQNMVDEAVQQLTQVLGYDNRQVVTELYG